MKRKILIGLLVLSMVPLTACSNKENTITEKVKPNTEKTIGSLKRNGVEIVVAKNTFENTVNVSIDKVSQEIVLLESSASYLDLPIQLSSSGHEHTLNETVIIKMKLPKSITTQDYLMLMGAYHDGEEWTYILPNIAALEKGVLEFETPHFSIFAPIKVDKEKALERYANTLAVQNVTSKPTTLEEKNLYEEINQYFSETLDAMGFTDQTAQGVIMQKLAEENVVGGILSNIKNGNVADVSGHAAEHIAKAIIKSSAVKKFKDTLPNAAGAAVSGAIAAAIELYETGDYATAYKELVYSASGFVPGVKIAKAVVEATKAGINMWENYSIEYAYTGVYLAQPIASDGSITQDSWQMVFHNMGSGLTFLQQNYRTAYAQANGMTLKQIDKDKALKERLNQAVENDVKRNFMKRYTQNAAIEKEQANIQNLLALFDEYGLLDPDVLLGFSHHMSLTQRLDSLLKIRQSILDLVGDLSVFGNTNEKIEDNLTFAVKMWLLHGKDRSKFYAWMQEQGYLKKPEENKGGYWHLLEVRNENKHFNEKQVDPKLWSNSIKGSNGTATLMTSYLGPSEEDDYEPRPKNGENGTITGSVSTPPQRIYGGESVSLDVNLSVSSTKQHFFDFRGDAEARFDETGIGIGGVTGASISFIAKDDEGNDMRLSAWVYAPTNWRATEYGNKPHLSTKVSAQAPNGHKEGDKISLYTNISFGNLNSRTEYIYTWHE